MRPSGECARRLWLALLPSVCTGGWWFEAGRVPTYRCEVLQTYPHDPQAFTQGLFYEANDIIVESTGLYGASSVRRVRLRDGRVVQQQRLPSDWFGEGVALLGDSCYQLLWREGIGAVRDARSLELRRTFGLPPRTEGWGLTTDGAELLYASDGSCRVRVMHAPSLSTRHTLNVRAAGVPVWRLNDLQWIDGLIWANVWQQDKLVVFDARTGKVTCFVDLSHLQSHLDMPTRQRLTEDEVLNGIAYDEHADRLFVTGKCWPLLFQIGVRMEHAHCTIGFGAEPPPR